MDVGPRFFLLALVGSDTIRRLQMFSLRRCEELAARSLCRICRDRLKKRSERRPKKPRVSVGSIEELLLSAGRAFPLVTIHREQVDPNVCWIGRMRGLDRSRVSLLEIGPDAKWEDSPEEYRVAEITRVSFGGE